VNARRTRVLMISSELVGERMAGPGIRTWELARVLSEACDVVLAVPPHLDPSGEPPEPDFAAELVHCMKVAELRERVQAAEVVITLGAVCSAYPFLLELDKPLVVDAYDPFMLAGLEQNLGAPAGERASAHERYRRAHLLALRAADLVLCASERQRDYWLGMLSALGRVNPLTYDESAELAGLIRVVPFGLRGAPPRKTKEVLKGVRPGIGPQDKVILWGGGIWDWFDAPTALRAMSIIAERRDDVRLVFLGVDRPDPKAAKMRAVRESLDLARSLELLDSYVFFNDWVPYEGRENYLLEADLGLSLHRPCAEARFSFRTRYLDCLWSGLPFVATEGDTLGEQLCGVGLAKLVPPHDDVSVAAAMMEMLDAPAQTGGGVRAAALAEEYRWDRVAEPLLAFCREPRIAPDKKYLRQLPALPTREPWGWIPSGLRAKLSRFRPGRSLKK